MQKPSKQELVKQILRECSEKVAQRPPQDGRREGQSYWTTRGLRSIRKQVKRNVDWEKAKLRVLPTAKKMGKVALPSRERRCASFRSGLRRLPPKQ